MRLLSLPTTYLKTRRCSDCGRYATREEVQKTIEQLDGWLVWGCRIRLTESKYSRSGKNEWKEGNGTVQEHVQPRNHILEGRHGVDEISNRRKCYKNALLKLGMDETV
ncbi:hypothetical protein PIB30_079209 [Stylosanthes scabra]|uniref:Uncharacterized protein n=1 Tax=Stylosanthes scabra TaxID=79078 RepID=A0ABU6SR75_9FABA|nr:hypothetical protein [Stylosanthes scabra]